MVNKEHIQRYREDDRALIRGDDFIYLLPHPALRGSISNYTLTFPSRESISESYTVIPHGCATLVFAYDGKGASSTLFGPATRPCIVGHRAGLFQLLLIVEFQPAGLYGLTGIKQKELRDRSVPFVSIEAKLDRAIIDLLEKARDLPESWWLPWTGSCWASSSGPRGPNLGWLPD